MRTASSSSTARLRVRRGASPCTVSASAIWSPTRITGFSAVIGSWKISEMPRAAHLAHLALGRARAGRGPRRGPARRSRGPAAAAAAGWRTPSPTCRCPIRRRGRASRPAAIWKLTSSTAVTVERRPANVTVRCWTSRSGDHRSFTSPETSLVLAEHPSQARRRSRRAWRASRPRR